MKRIVLTGPSSSGKSTMINELQDRGYTTMPEVARPVLELGIEDFKTRQCMIGYAQLYAESVQQPSDICFYDRSAIDCMGFSKHYGFELPSGLVDKIRESTYDQVFYLEQLPFFIEDGTRVETDINESAAIGRELFAQYQATGHNVEIVPVLGVEDRVNYILERIDLR